MSPLYESVPPKLYGGTERVVSYLTEELINQGHDVTLFASGDSITNARLIPVCNESLRLNKNCEDQIAHHFILLEKVIREMEDFDLIHYHIDYFHFLASRHLCKVPYLTTLHGRLNIPDLVPLYREYPEMPVVSISYAQREPLPALNWIGNVYHGLPENLFSTGHGTGDYLAFLGRISPEKGLERAIQIAKESGILIKIAAKVDVKDKEYFEEKIQPLLDSKFVEYVGEIGEKDKQDFLGNARALLFPINWHEPFGLVMIESLACGTPVIAYPNGSVPEIIEHSNTGFIVNSMQEAVCAVKNLSNLDRTACRKAFEERFTVSRMTSDYVNIYKSLLSSGVKDLPYEVSLI